MTTLALRGHIDDGNKRTACYCSCCLQSVIKSPFAAGCRYDDHSSAGAALELLPLLRAWTLTPATALVGYGVWHIPIFFPALSCAPLFLSPLYLFCNKSYFSLSVSFYDAKHIASIQRR